MENINKNKYIFIGIAVIGLLILFIIIGLVIMNNRGGKNPDSSNVTPPNNSQNNNPNNVPSYPINNNPDDGEIDLSTWKTYKFDKNYIIPNFELKYPSDWEENFCTASGCWNINLAKDDREILIDISGQGSSTFEQSLSDWITNFGSYSINYTFEINKQATLTNGDRKYIIYEVTEENKSPYIIAIVDIAEMYEGRGHLAIKASDIQDIDFVKEILESIE